MDLLINNFLIACKRRNIKLTPKIFHQEFIKYIFGDFFDFSKEMPTLRSGKSYHVDGKQFDPKIEGRELFKSVPTMLKVQGKQMFELIEHMNTVDTLSGKVRFPPKHFLINFGNSCGPDSILFILFFFENGYFMDIIANNPGDSDPNCSKSLDFRNDIRDPLLDLYTSGEYNKKIIKIQGILSKYLEVRGCSDIKSGTEIWNMFSAAFSNLQFLVQTKRGEEIKNNPYHATYLEPIQQNNPDNITSDAPHLIYGDDLPAMERDLRDEGFGMDHGNYILTAVIFFMMNGHYTAALRANERWWYYDDMSQKVKILKNPENGIFSERVSKKAQLLFYGRVSENIKC